MKMNEKELKTKRVSILAIGIMIYFLYGIKMSWSLFGSALIAENGWTELQASLPYSLQTLVSAVWAIVGGRMADKLPAKWVVIQGGVCTGLGLAMCGLSSNWWVVLIGCGVFIAMGSSVSAALTSTVIKWWPHNKKGFAGGLLTASTSMNTVLLTPIFNILLVAVGMRTTCALSGAFIAIVISILALFLKEAPREMIELTPEMIAEMDAEAAQKKKKARKLFLSPYNNAPIRKIITSPQFAMWILLYFFACLSGQVATSQISSIAKTLLDWPASLSWVTVTVSGLGAFLGRYCMSALGDRLGAFRSYTLTFLIQAAMCFLFPSFSGYVAVTFGIFAIGFGFGGTIALANVGNTDLWGKGNLGTMYGVTALGYSAAGLVGPSAAAMIRDTTGSYGIMFYALGVCALIGIIFSEYLNRWADPAKQK